MFRKFLAPIHEYSDLPFRLLCQKYGAEAACIPMIDARRTVRKNSPVSDMDINPAEKNIGIQIVGSEPDGIGRACRIIDDSYGFVSWYNLNCGCPTERTRGCGGGSAMLRYPEKIADAVEEMGKNVGKKISVKIRITDNHDEAMELCRLIENAGADFIIIHGRTASQRYSGEADWELIRKLKASLDILVIGNGDIKSASQGEGYMKNGYCDGFMIARSAMKNPMVFSNRIPADYDERCKLFKEYVATAKEYEVKLDIHREKAKAINFMNGVENASALRNRIVKTKTMEELLQLLESHCR